MHATIDRRGQPSHGYRAVHVVVTNEGRQIEIQVRTQLQHLWAELSEKLSDKVDPRIKYGGGDDEIRSFLSEASARIVEVERAEQRLDEIKRSAMLTEATGASLLRQAQAQLMLSRTALAAQLQEVTALVLTLKEERG